MATTTTTATVRAIINTTELLALDRYTCQHTHTRSFSFTHSLSLPHTTARHVDSLFFGGKRFFFSFFLFHAIFFSFFFIKSICRGNCFFPLLVCFYHSPSARSVCVCMGVLAVAAFDMKRTLKTGGIETASIGAFWHMCCRQENGVSLIGRGINCLGVWWRNEHDSRWNRWRAVYWLNTLSNILLFFPSNLFRQTATGAPLRVYIAPVFRRVLISILAQSSIHCRLVPYNTVCVCVCAWPRSLGPLRK